jgi:hypothetical protein
MKAVVQVLDTGSRAVTFLLGGLVVVLAAAMLTTAVDASDIADWAQKVFGLTFLALIGGLVFTALFCWVKMSQTPGDKVWLEAGLQAANGITTLALTYTLLGISLGVGGLAEQQLTPETVQGVVRDLTEKFSLAFMTTVVGLPVSAILRTLLLVTRARHHQRGAVTTAS